MKLLRINAILVALCLLSACNGSGGDSSDNEDGIRLSNGNILHKDLLNAFLLKNGKTGKVIKSLKEYRNVKLLNGVTNRLWVLQESKIGMIDFDGNIIIPPQYSHLSDFTHGVARVNAGGFNPGMGVLQGGTWGIIDTNGNEVIPLKYEWIGDFNGGLAPFHLYVDYDRSAPLPPYNHGYLNKNGKQIIGCKFHGAAPFSEGYAAVMRFEKGEYLSHKERYAFINTQGEEITPYKYDKVLPFSEGMAAVFTEEGGYGFIDHTGQEVIAPGYSDAKSFEDGKAIVTLNGRKFYIDKQGKELAETVSSLY